MALRIDWLSVHRAAASCGGKSHLDAMCMATFSPSYDEVIAAPRCCFESRVVGLAESPSVTTISTPRFSVPVVVDPLVWMMNRAFRCLMNYR